MKAYKFYWCFYVINRLNGILFEAEVVLLCCKDSRCWEWRKLFGNARHFPLEKLAKPISVIEFELCEYNNAGISKYA